MNDIERLKQTISDLSDRYDADLLYCNICNNKILDADNCHHWPGNYYDVDDKKVMCVAIQKGISE